MKLLSIQRRMASAIMTPLTQSERMRSIGPVGRSLRKLATEIIRPNDRLCSFERLEIYNRQYWIRVLSGLAEDFPGLRAILGERRFDAVSKAYLQDCPSRSFTLRNLGSHLESWLRRNPRWAGSRQKLVLDMVRLEWAEIESFDGKSESALKPADLTGDPAGLKLKLQPHIQLLDLQYPVDDLLLEVRKHEVNTETASNAFNACAKRKSARSVARLSPSPVSLVVHRLDHSIYFRRLERGEFFVLKELRAGKTLSAAIQSTLCKIAITPSEAAKQVQQWFHAWAALGWFCRVEDKHE
jgi:hypothetical protein